MMFLSPIILFLTTTAQRTPITPFEAVAFGLTSGIDKAQDAAHIASFAQAGPPDGLSTFIPATRWSRSVNVFTRDHHASDDKPLGRTWRERSSSVCKEEPAITTFVADRVASWLAPIPQSQERWKRRDQFSHQRQHSRRAAGLACQHMDGLSPCSPVAPVERGIVSACRSWWRNEQARCEA
ncbi:MAG: hypothetical protein J2P36_26060 [Ktedonobacteraceae bacterium]|nr:hypothetical protein [Ktedonobacteraceae bacterium]